MLYFWIGSGAALQVCQSMPDIPAWIDQVQLGATQIELNNAGKCIIERRFRFENEQGDVSVHLGLKMAGAPRQVVA